MAQNLARDVHTIWRKDMQVWMKKPLFVIVRSLLFPLIYLLIFANAFGGSLYNLPIAVVNLDSGDASLAFSNGLGVGNTLRIRASTSYAEALSLFESRQVYAVVVIPRGFSAGGANPPIELMVDQSSPAVASAITGVVNSAAARFGGTGGGVEVSKDVHYARGASYLDFLTPGVIIQTIAMGSLFSGGVSLLFEKQLGVFNQLLVAPVDKLAIILGKILSAVTQSMVSGLAAIGIALLLGVKIRTGATGLVFLIILMFLVSFCFIGLGVAMTSYISDFQAWMMTMQLIIMPLWFVSGTFYPIESMAPWLSPLATISPMTYATRAARNIMIRGAEFSAISADLWILAGMGTAMLIAGILSFRRTVE